MGAEIKVREAITIAKNISDALKDAFQYKDAIDSLGGITGTRFADYYDEFSEPDGSNQAGEYPIVAKHVVTNLYTTIASLEYVFTDGQTVSGSSGHNTNLQDAIIAVNKILE